MDFTHAEKGSGADSFGMGKDGKIRYSNYRITNQTIAWDFYVVNFEKTFRFNFEIYIYGYLWPVLTIGIVFLNVLLLYIFTKTRLMSRNATHFVIGTICLFDVFTITFPAILYVYVFDILGIRMYLPFELCSVWYLLTDITPTVCHCTSILLTVCLACQRYLSVTYPFEVGRWCTPRRTAFAMFVCFVVSFVMEASESGMYRWKKVTVSLPNNTTTLACSIEPTTDAAAEYAIPHVILWAALFKVIPCIILIVLGSKMIRQVRKASTIRKYIVGYKRDTKSHEAHRERKLTILIGWVIAIFLVFEVPSSIAIVLTLISSVFNLEIISRHNLETALSILYVIIIATFSSNFVVYYTCCDEFKKYLKSMFRCSKSTDEQEPQNSNISMTSVTTISQNSQDT